MNVIFNKVIAKDGQTAAERFAAMVKDPNTFYAVDNELYKGDVLLSANTAAEIAVADAEGKFEGTDVEAVLAEIFAGAVDKTIWFHDESAGQSDYAKVYKIYQGENDYVADRTDGKTNPVLKGTINIPKDLVVKSGSVVAIFFDDTDDTLHEGSISGTDVTDLIIPEGGTATAADAGKYIKLEIQNQDDPLYIAVKDLVDVYTGGTTAEATVAIDANNEITVTINKIAATKIIYQAAAEAVYEVDATVDATNFDDKVAAGLYTESDGVYTKLEPPVTFDAGETYYVQTSPATAEINAKAKIDQVETDLNALADYVGEIPATSESTTVIDYVDEKTGEGVGSLNSDADIAAKSGKAVTLKGGIVEKAGMVTNKPATPVTTNVEEGYYNPADGKFYEENTFVTEIPGAPDTLYKDLDTGKKYIFDVIFKEVADDITLADVASTGNAEDLVVSDVDDHFTGTDAEAIFAEIGETLTWVEV